MKELRIDREKVDDCVDKSLDDLGSVSKLGGMLYNDRIAANSIGITESPSVAINHIKYHGAMKGEDIFNTICQAYHINQKPEVCTAQYELTESIGHFESDFVQPFTLRNHHLVWALIFVALFNVILLYCCVRRKSKQETQAV